MCYAYGSLDQAISVCPMCQVFPHSRCPHIRDVCRNRTLHPHLDVSYLKNAEVDSFNGCGYCKWARTNPPAKLSGYNNPGWPGCCRTPSPNEYRLIQAADWRPVSIVHHIPVPPEVKATLENLAIKPNPGNVTPSATLSRASGAKPIPSDRKGSVSGSPPSKASSPMAGKLAQTHPNKLRTGGSPKQGVTALSTSSPRSPTLVPSLSSPQSLVTDHPQMRRQSIEPTDKPPSTNQPSPGRRILDLDPQAPATPVRRNPVSQKTIATVPGSPPSNTKITSETRLSTPTSKRSSSVAPGPSSLPPEQVSRRSNDQDDDARSSTSNSSGSIGSSSGSTVTSDGGFTDYLSDESEAELQRQAEARAALLAQNQAEELEFKMARQQLAYVDLRPPKSWNSTTLAAPVGQKNTFGTQFDTNTPIATRRDIK